MAGEFSEEQVEKAWTRSGGKCECVRVNGGYIIRCNLLLVKSFRGDRDSQYGWEAYSKSGLYLDSLSDIDIYCWNPCQKATL